MMMMLSCSSPLSATSSAREPRPRHASNAVQPACALAQLITCSPLQKRFRCVRYI